MRKRKNGCPEREGAGSRQYSRNCRTTVGCGLKNNFLICQRMCSTDPFVIESCIGHDRVSIGVDCDAQCRWLDYNDMVASLGPLAKSIRYAGSPPPHESRKCVLSAKGR